MKYLKWAGLVLLALVVYAFVEQKDDATKAVIWCSLGLGYGLYQIAKTIDSNHAKTVRMFERLQNTIRPQSLDDSDF